MFDVSRLRVLIPLAFACVPCWATTAWGQEDAAFAEASEFPVVLTASRMKQSLLKAPSAVTVIDREMIEKSGVRQIADLLRFVPGAVVGYNDGNWPVATLRGMSGAYVSALQVLVDGVTVYSPLWGGMLWNELALAPQDIERIEVIRGPNAALFGPNSFTGVINIITREPLADKGTRLSMNAGQRGIADLAYSGSGEGGGWNYRFTLGQRADDGFDSRPDSQRLTFGNLKAEYRLDPADSLSISARWSGSNKGLGDYAVRGSGMQPHTTYGHGLDFQVRWTRAQSADDEVWVQYYHQQKNDYNHVTIDLRDAFSLPRVGPFASPLPYLVDIDYDVQRDGVEFQQTHRWNETVRSVWGLESRRDSVKSARLLGTEDERSVNLNRAFANMEWRFASQWTLHAAAMIEHNSLAKSSWSPKLAVTYEVAPGHVLRASLSRAQRTPTILDKYANYYFDVNLPVVGGQRVQYRQSTGIVNSETVYSEEVGYVFELPQQHLTVDTRWFRDRYRGLVGQVRYDMVNQDDAVLEGGDITVGWEPLKGTRLRISGAENHVRSTNLGGAYTGSVPTSTLALFWDQRLPDDYGFSLNYQRVSAMAWLDSAQKKLRNPPIDYLNLRLNKPFNLGSTKGEVSWVMQNALGHHHEYYMGILGTPLTVAKRTSFIQISLAF